MSNYTPSTDFAAKDSLLSGNPNKIVKGTEITAELTSIAAAVATKADSSSSNAFQAGATTLGATTATSLNSTPIGNSAPSTGAFTTLSASSGINATAIGNTSASTGAFTTLSATGNASVGTASNPNSRRLYVNGVGSGSTWVSICDTVQTGNEVLVGQDPTSSLAYLSSSAFGIAFSVGGSERARIDTAGNLGLGVTPKTWSAGKALEIGASGNGIWSYAGVNRLTQNAYYNTGWIYAATGAAALYEQVSDTHIWKTAPSGTAGNAITFTQNLSLTGTSTNATLKLSNGTSGSGASDGFDLIMDGTDAYVYNRENGPVLFGTNNTERARIDSSGNFLVGTTSASSSKFVVSADLNNQVQYVVNTNTTATGAVGGIYVNYTAASPNSTAFDFFRGTDSSATRVQLRSNGGIANYQANDANLSDERLKKDFAPAKSYYDKWKDIEFVTFLYKDQTDTELNLGVKAQQLESVFPELIDNSGFGDAPEGEAPYKAVYQTDFQYATAKALQEAIAKIEALETRLAALEAA